jgi:hypothetical protein
MTRLKNKGWQPRPGSRTYRIYFFSQPNIHELTTTSTFLHQQRLSINRQPPLISLQQLHQPLYFDR